MLKENRIKIIVVIFGVIALITGIAFYYIKENHKQYENINEEEIFENEKNNILTNGEKSENTKITIHIAGEVIKPGVIELEENSRVIDAINKAGGLTEKADIKQINLAYILSDAEKIYIPSKEENQQTSNISTSSKSQSENTSSTKIMVNINSANSEQLQKIPGIGETIASRIINYRKENGKFKQIEDIKNVSGIGESKFKNIKEYICVK